MGVKSMALDQNWQKEIENFCKTHLREWLRAGDPLFQSERYLQLQERQIRVEEELKAQRGLIELGFRNSEIRSQEWNARFEEHSAQMEKRFDLVEKRIDQVDKRFESMQIQMDKRFEQVDKRLEQVDRRFEQVDKRFEQVDKRFEAVQVQMDRRFDQVDKRFTSMQWLIGLGMSLIVALMSLYQFLN